MRFMVDGTITTQNGMTHKWRRFVSAADQQSAEVEAARIVACQHGANLIPELVTHCEATDARSIL